MPMDFQDEESSDADNVAHKLFSAQPRVSFHARIYTLRTRVLQHLFIYKLKNIPELRDEITDQGYNTCLTHVNPWVQLPGSPLFSPHIPEEILYPLQLPSLSL